MNLGDDLSCLRLIYLLHILSLPKLINLELLPFTKVDDAVYANGFRHKCLDKWFALHNKFLQLNPSPKNGP